MNKQAEFELCRLAYIAEPEVERDSETGELLEPAEPTGVGEWWGRLGSEEKPNGNYYEALVDGRGGFFAYRDEEDEFYSYVKNEKLPHEDICDGGQFSVVFLTADDAINAAKKFDSSRVAAAHIR